MQVITETELLARINAFLQRHDMARTTFGRNATGEPQLISSIEKGRSPSLSVVSRLLDFMNETDEAARLKEKLTAPLDAEPPEEVEQPLPFSSAPVNPTGASSPISSTTAAQPTSSAANGSSRLTAADQGDARSSNSCSAEQGAEESAK